MTRKDGYIKNSDNSIEINTQIRNIGLILFTGFFLGYVIPLSICTGNKGVNNGQVLQILNNESHIKTHETDTIKLKKYYFVYYHNKAIDSQIYNFENSSKDLSIGYKNTIKKFDSAKVTIPKDSHVKIYGFMESKASLVWPIIIAALLIIYLVILPVKPEINPKVFLLTFSPVTIVYLFPTFLRAFSPDWQSGRTIYSVYNYDINPFLYGYNIFLDVVIITIMVLIWLKCNVYIIKTKNERFTNYSMEGILDALHTIKRNYTIWQCYSVCLFAAFGLLLYMLYSYVFIDHDGRYIFQAIFYNFLYLFTWILGSLPLYFEFELWQRFKDRILFDKEIYRDMSSQGVDMDALRKAIPEYEIASSLNHIMTIILSSFSLFIPLISPIIKAWLEYNH